jgi:hypothetical protein
MSEELMNTTSAPNHAPRMSMPAVFNTQSFHENNKQSRTFDSRSNEGFKSEIGQT